MAIARTTLKTTIEDVHHPIVLGYQALHWDTEQAEWIVDDGQFEKIYVAPSLTTTPAPIPTPIPTLVPPVVTLVPTLTPAPVPPAVAIATPAPGQTEQQQSITEIFAGWLAWLKGLLKIS